jgi:hypothetical protein
VVSRTVAAGTAKVSWKESFGGYELVADGAVDFARQRGQLRFQARLGAGVTVLGEFVLADGLIYQRQTDGYGSWLPWGPAEPGGASDLLGLRGAVPGNDVIDPTRARPFRRDSVVF